MVKLKFTSEIKAPKDKVWSVLWDDDTYRKWTGVFHEGSYASSDWQEGSKIFFLNADGSGLSSIIEKKINGELITFKHLYIVKDGKEQTDSEESKSWTGARESYLIQSKGDSTVLTVDLDSVEEFADYMNKTFPKALEVVKTLSENN